MDFVSIASALYSGHRFLHEGDNEDDILGDYTESSTVTISANVPLSPSINESFASSPLLDEEHLDISSGSVTSQQPLLSATAEVELYLLATNFLLYVAMVIITTLVAKIYFPEAVERGPASNHMPRSESYIRVAEDAASYYSDEDDAEGGKEEVEGVEGVEGEALINNNNHKRNKLESNSNRKSDNFLEFEQSTSPKLDVMKRLSFCCLMLNVTFVTWGLLQERMLTRKYPRLTGEVFTYSYALVFSNRFWTLIMSGLLLLYLKPHRSRTTVVYEYAFPSISNMLSSWCQYEALRYITFPAVTIFKSFKLVPVMLMGKILGNKEYAQYDYIVALIIGAGIALFMSSSDDLQFGYDIYMNETSGKWTGIMLLGFFLFFDSFTSQWQSRMFQRHRDLSMIELLFATSAFSTFLSFITLIHQHELRPAINFVIKHSEIQVHFFLFSVCSTIGQLFIFYTIKNFGAVVFTIIMTARVLLSIAISCVLFDHTVSPVGFLGLSMVMGAILYRIKRKAEGTQLIKWQGMGNDKAVELVQEWHEHLDT